jgi:hypothetical protein
MKQIFTCITVLFLFTLLTGSVFGQNILINGDMEDVTLPGFWNTLNSTGQSTWASDTAAATFNSRRSFKINKAAVTSDVVGWRSDNNADTYWNNAGSGLYALKFSAKTEGVNTAPADDNHRIYALFTFKAGGVDVGSKMVAVDQATASSGWTDFADVTDVTGEPDEVSVDLVMGKDATGTVWFDNVDCNTSANWTMGMFGGDAETPNGWTNWADGEKIGFSNFVQDDDAHSGSYSVLLEENDNLDDEMVFNGNPVPAKSDTWYKIGVWVKTEGVNSGDSLHATNITTARDNDRIGITILFHKAPIETSWDVLGPGDLFFYVDQTNDSTGWTHYNVVTKSPAEDVGGVSMRARFTSFPTGKAYYDDFTIEELDVDPNIVVNGDIEDVTLPGFWSSLNSTGESTWASDTAAATFNSRRSFKINKMAATSDVVGWRSDNNADTYWNNAGSGLYALNFSAKTEGVNTAPVDDDHRIYALFTFKAGGVDVGSKMVTVDQTEANTSWTDFADVTDVTGEPDEVSVDLVMGKDATGTVWFDNINCNTSANWTMGMFGGDAETPDGWTNWADGEKIGFANFVEDDDAHSGSYSVLLEENDDLDDEMVFNGNPVPAVSDTWYKISVWVKTEGVNSGEKMHASNITTARDNDRMGITILFHKAPIETSWDVLGPGDLFFYVDQTNDSTGWTQYNVITKSPAEDVGGVSMRARFTSFPTGKAYYDDFSITPVDLMVTALETPQNITTITPSDFRLNNNYPNPFNPETIIEYLVPKNGQVKIIIYNILGQKVRTLVNEVQTAGTYQVYWNGKNDQNSAMSSGVYFYQLQGDNALITKKMTLLK